MKCKICSSPSLFFYKGIVLEKYDVTYCKCEQCGFIQTEEPYWLSEAYESAITNLDIGLVSRNLYLKEEVPKIINSFFEKSRIMIDYGGGYGLFVRMMRDLGYHFYRQDIYCENLFAKHFDIKDVEHSTFDILTTFEVFEHLNHPLPEIEKMFLLSENIIFTTLLAPDNAEDFKNWWYLAPTTGQHISFYTEASLAFIAKKYNKHFYTNKNNLHVFSNEKIGDSTVEKVFTGPQKDSLWKKIRNHFSYPKIQHQSLLQNDFEFIKSKIGQKI